MNVLAIVLLGTLDADIAIGRATTWSCLLLMTSIPIPCRLIAALTAGVRGVRRHRHARLQIEAAHAQQANPGDRPVAHTPSCIGRTELGDRASPVRWY